MACSGLTHSSMRSQHRPAGGRPPSSLRRFGHVATSRSPPTMRQRALARSRTLYVAARVNGARIPDIVLLSARFGPIPIAAITGRAAILYFDAGGLDQQSQARDDARARSFRDCYPRLLCKGYHLVGVHAQSADHQLHQMMNGVEHILAADPELHLAAALGLPTYWKAGVRTYRPITLVVEEATVMHVFYPLPTTADATSQLLGWLAKFRPRGALVR